MTSDDQRSPSTTYRPFRPDRPAIPAPDPRTGLSARALIALTAGVSATVTAIVMVVVMIAGLAVWNLLTAEASGTFASEGDPGSFESFELMPGTVRDSSGGESEHTGGFGNPAHVGEDRLVWDTYDGGTLTATISSLNWDADAQVAADLSHVPPPDGTQYVLVEATVDYEGPSEFLVEDFWITVEHEVGEYNARTGILPATESLEGCPPLEDGDSCTGFDLIPVPSSVIDHLSLRVETADGDPLYVEQIG
ncbi:MAG: hypothetical protein Q4G40_01845 [Brachybacterium sp.]|nr:hypothetical protein [Brachybacterium sp.]